MNHLFVSYNDDQGRPHFVKTNADSVEVMVPKIGRFPSFRIAVGPDDVFMIMEDNFVTWHRDTRQDIINNKLLLPKDQTMRAALAAAKDALEQLAAISDPVACENLLINEALATVSNALDCPE